MAVIQVSAGGDRGYAVTVESGILDRCGELLSPLFTGNKIAGGSKVALITDTNVERLYLPLVRASLERAGYEVCAYAFPAGEESKNFATLSDILEFLAENRLTRSDAIVALGGGVVGDIAGFAAGCYLRGVKYAQIPTTLLAFVDSSVGGKTAVDLRAGKNLAGLFYPPAAVIADPDCLDTLPDETLADGAAEVIKTGILDGEDLFSLAEHGDIRRNAARIIEMCIAYKAKIVGMDEFERGPRKLLNLGHTVAHAIEKLSDYRVPHGRAVATGIAVITRAAKRLGMCPPSNCARIIAALRACGLPTETSYGAAELAEAALADKKRAGENITLVLPRGIGKCELVVVPVDNLRSIIEKGLEPSEDTQ
jgi:3-dehydroquinate synthase